MPEEAPLTVPPAASAVVETALAAVREAGVAAPRIVIDGRSGAGKTTVARALAAAWPGACRLVSLDEFYPGWSGLREGSRIAAGLLAAHASGRTGRYRRWDWERGVWDAKGDPVDPAVPLVVEGCGALSVAAARHATASIWMDGDAGLRRERALARDGEGFEPFWDMWADQESAHIRREDPQALATTAITAC